MGLLILTISWILLSNPSKTILVKGKSLFLYNGLFKRASKNSWFET